MPLLMQSTAKLLPEQTWQNPNTAERGTGWVGLETVTLNLHVYPVSKEYIALPIVVSF
jgi:hypothetical protein